MRRILLLTALVTTGCGLFTREHIRGANDVARDLCALHAREVKPGISAKEIADTFCNDLRPWLDLVGTVQKTGVQRSAP